MWCADPRRHSAICVGVTRSRQLISDGARIDGAVTASWRLTMRSLLAHLGRCALGNHWIERLAGDLNDLREGCAIVYG